MITSSEILACASSLLVRNGYEEGTNVALSDIDRGSHRIFEDAYGIVAVVVFSSWQDLVAKWTDVQGAFVELISTSVAREESKSWEGYLALLTPGLVAESEQGQIERISQDTGRVRKLITTGAHLQDQSDVETALLSLLPLQEAAEVSSNDNILSRLPNLLSGPNLSKEAISSVVQAFQEQSPLVEALHSYLGAK
jgi:hypothetical protein